MKLLIYLRFFRPLRSLFLVAAYTGLAGWAFGPTFFQLDPRTAWLIALTVALPLLLGVFIGGAVHEPMHRPFALLLPGLRERQRMAATFSVLIAALATTCVAALASPSVSPVGSFGLACALISFPCINRHQALSGGGSVLISVAIWLFTCLAVGPKLAPTLNAFPWAFLFGGLAICATCLVRGFSRGSLRSRTHTLFIAFQTNLCSYYFHRGMLARWLAELAARKNQLKQGGATAGRNWTVRSVGPNSLDWMRVFGHANYGGRKRSSFFEVQMTFVFIIFMNAVIFSGIDRFSHHHSFWTSLARIGAADLTSGVTSFALQPFMIVLCALTLHPQRLAYPISRLRLARIEFWQIITQLATGLVIVALSLLLASLIGQAVSGKFFPSYGLPPLLTIDLQMAVLLPLFIAAGKLQHHGLRIFAGVSTVAAMILTPFVTSHWGSLLLTPPGILTLLAAAAVSQWVLWRRLHRHYATVDLASGGNGFMFPFLLGGAAPR